MSDNVSAQRVLEANTAAWVWWRYQATLWDDWTRDYLSSRGLRGVQAGYAPGGWTRLVNALRRRGFTDTELLAAGLATLSSKGNLIDYYRDRLVLAVRDRNNEILGFTARHTPLKAGGSKYLNTPGTVVYTKGQALYGLDAAAARNLAHGATPVLVEGALDVEATRRVGGAQVVLSACGTAITAEQLDALRAIDPACLTRLVVAYDADAGGRGEQRGSGNS
ncbi:hypothetical protein GCM10025865_33750 (plasmid) [Paraoerskovia sediminicola]|uniref:DNA primase DNAG catalytic core N-terminal domain-containing protein n=1 Tax=Paraoerskovia sediminicola TaxID=1138587 RepID=A0ABN6XGK3_9CELL|nr:toprim domain-containing protein [Paraoerskovia sediminicola]BDZ44032.1 hypothetical protein GCM10025865_33310 [Paraoerskovia sediminicola]BDZ44076.1 hypothetical protein GCM10025865_33750 [Paraoerskovia sediminicola]